MRHVAAELADVGAGDERSAVTDHDDGLRAVLDRLADPVEQALADVPAQRVDRRVVDDDERDVADVGGDGLEADGFGDRSHAVSQAPAVPSLRFDDHARGQTPDVIERSITSGSDPWRDRVAGEVAVGMEGALEAAHAGEPAVAIGGLALDVGGDLGMGEDQELLVADRLQAQLSHVGRVEHAVAARHATLETLVVPAGLLRHRVLRAVGDDVRRHRLRAQHREADALMVMADRQPLGQGDRRRLGHRVRHRADLRQQAGGGRRAQDVALATSDHRRQHRTGRVDVGHAVHLPHRLDRLVACPPVRPR